MKLSFSTLGCPDWEWEKIINEAYRLGYDGIEVRGVAGELFIPNIPQFQLQNIELTLRRLEEKNLKIICFGTSCKFHSSVFFNESISEGKKTIDIASKAQVPYIRVFGDKIPSEVNRNEVFLMVASGIEELVQYGIKKNVKVLLEVHGDFNTVETLSPVLSRIKGSKPGLIWDIAHSDKVYGDKFEIFYDALKPYIIHVHIKDHIRNEGFALCEVGKGDIPIERIIKKLKKERYKGYLSLEWEKKWHPDLVDAGIVFPEYVKFMKKLIAS